MCITMEYTKLYVSHPAKPLKGFRQDKTLQN